MTWALMIAAILLEAGATISLRLANGLERPILLVVSAAGYVATFALVSAVLQRGWTLALTYGVWAAGGIVLLAITDRLLFDETIRWTGVVGMFVIIVGIALMHHGSSGGHGAAAPGPSAIARHTSLEGTTDER